MAGNNVSHANNRTKRRFLPNLQNRRFFVESRKPLGLPARVERRSARHRQVGIDAVLADMRARGEKSNWSRIWPRRPRQDQAGIDRRYGSLLHHDKNKRNMPAKMEIKKFDPDARKHVDYKETKIK